MGRIFVLVDVSAGEWVKKKHNKSCMSTNWNLSEIKTIREGVTTITGSCILTDTIMMASYLVRYQKNYFN